jgi:hypothetical protein
MNVRHLPYAGLLLIALTSTPVFPQARNKPSGTYATQATDLWSQIAGGSTPTIVRSPDGQSQVLARYTESKEDERVILEVSGHIGSLNVDIGPGVSSELLWAPDSKAFFVTTSDQGANGSYRLIVVSKIGDKLASRDISPLIYKTFGHPVQCGWPEVPNVGGIAWLGSDRLLVAAEIVNHSNCDSFGTFQTYDIDTQRMKVLRSYDQLQAKHKFASLLGAELANAPDECVRNPKSCYVSTNHQKNSASTP